MSCHHLYSVLSIQHSPPPRPPPPEIPKSPPKWPLRPGVMVHVKVDTKQNLCASRTQNPSSMPYTPNTSSAITAGTGQNPNEQQLNMSNVSYASPLLNKTPPTTGDAFVQMDAKDNVCTVSATNGSSEISMQPPPPPPALPARNILGKLATSSASAPSKTSCSSELLTRENPTDENSNNTTMEQTTLVPNAPGNNDELITFTSSSLIEKILSRLRWRRERTKHSSTGTGASNNDNCGSGNNAGDGTSILSKRNRRTVSLLRGTGWFGSGKSTNSSTGLFDKDHHLNGITCDDGGKVHFFFFISFFLLQFFSAFFFCCKALHCIIITYFCCTHIVHIAYKYKTHNMHAWHFLLFMLFSV